VQWTGTQRFPPAGTPVALAAFDARVTLSRSRHALLVNRFDSRSSPRILCLSVAQLGESPPIAPLW